MTHRLAVTLQELLRICLGQLGALPEEQVNPGCFKAGTPFAGATYTNHGVHLDIVQDRRTVTGSALAMEGRRFSASLVTIELVPTAQGRPHQRPWPSSPEVDALRTLDLWIGEWHCAGLPNLPRPAR